MMGRSPLQLFYLNDNKLKKITFKKNQQHEPVKVTHLNQGQGAFKECNDVDCTVYTFFILLFYG